MEEIQIFKDKELSEEIKESIQFLLVVAGETTVKKIYIKNTIDYKLNVNLFLEGENISITKSIRELLPKETKEVVFELTPKITLMKPITAKLKIKINYVVK